MSSLVLRVETSQELLCTLEKLSPQGTAHPSPVRGAALVETWLILPIVSQTTTPAVRIVCNWFPWAVPSARCSRMRFLDGSFGDTGNAGERGSPLSLITTSSDNSAYSSSILSTPAGTTSSLSKQARGATTVEGRARAAQPRRLASTINDQRRHQRGGAAWLRACESGAKTSSRYVR